VGITITVTAETAAATATTHELAVRHAMEEALAAALRGLGRVDGGDSGLGHMTIFVVDVHDTVRAQNQIETVIARRPAGETWSVDVADDRDAIAPMRPHSDTNDPLLELGRRQGYVTSADLEALRGRRD
jgi:hypothetical protein